MTKLPCAMCPYSPDMIIKLSRCKINNDKMLILGLNAADDTLRGVIVDDKGIYKDINKYLNIFLFMHI